MITINGTFDEYPTVTITWPTGDQDAVDVTADEFHALLAAVVGWPEVADQLGVRPASGLLPIAPMYRGGAR